jgi:hypothetical protein
MPSTMTITDQWLALPHKDLAEQVRRAVRGGANHSSMWTGLSAHPVLAARVSGLLSALQAQMVGHRDEAMWTMWITQARQSLAAGPLPVGTGLPRVAVFRA